MSPLMYAAKEGRVTVCEKLLEQGAEINKQDMRGWTVSVVILWVLEMKLVFVLVLTSWKH